MKTGTPIITLHQPWATFIAYGNKPIESRTHDRFKNLVGRRIGIHAGKGWDEGAAHIIGAFPENVDKRFRFEFPTGEIVCTAFVVAHRRLTDADKEASMLNNGVTMSCRFGLFLDQIKLVQFKASGKQGIWYSEAFDEYLQKQERAT